MCGFVSNIRLTKNRVNFSPDAKPRIMPHLFLNLTAELHFRFFVLLDHDPNPGSVDSILRYVK